MKKTLLILTRNPLSLIGLILVAIVVFSAIFADFITPFPEHVGAVVDFVNFNKPPQWPYIFGTDLVGRDLTEEIDLIMVDAEMPEMDGYVLTRNIKADPRFENIPVVMHSSLSSEANRAMGKRVGVDAYVAKFDADVLADTLRPMLERAQRAA